MSEASSNRRSFVSRLLIGTGAAIALPLLYGIGRFLQPPRVLPASLMLGDKQLPTEPGAPDIVRLGVKDAAILRGEHGEIRALSLTCTHTGCSVHWRASSRQFHCPCHNGSFAADGSVIAGPPRRSLQRLRVELAGDGVRIVDEPA